MNTEERTAIEGHTLLLFDGLCGLCHGAIRFLMRRDPSRRLLYIPQESPLGRELLEATRSKDTGIVVIEAALTPRQSVTTHSDAVIQALYLLRGAWPWVARLLALIPRGVRESAYGWIARWRYKVFRAYKVCPLPSVAERGVILGAGG